MNGGGDINSLGLLPDKLKTELALHVNLETLRKVRSTRFVRCPSQPGLQCGLSFLAVLRYIVFGSDFTQFYYVTNFSK